MTIWQLPEGMGELVGKQASHLEKNRRILLDYYCSKNYQLVIPAIAEYVDSLLLKTSQSLDNKTFKVVDQNNGKMLGIHADITPQIARIDSQYSNENTVAKFCYINAILQTHSDDFYSTRSPIQAGAEIYGDGDVAADIEVMTTMLESIQLLGLKQLTLNLANLGIFYRLVEREHFSDTEVLQLKDIINQKAKHRLAQWLTTKKCRCADELMQLLELNGGLDVIKRAEQIFKKYPDILSMLASLAEIGQTIKTYCADIHIDLAEVKAYEYHTGLLFSVYHNRYQKALAQGGRYDDLSNYFGRSRFATGFSFDLKYLTQHRLEGAY